MEDFLKKVCELVYGEIEKTGVPTKPQADLAVEVGKRLAKKLEADVNIVEAGTLLMDCVLGQALIENRRNDHIKMSLKKADELLVGSSLSDEEKDNIRHCILEHHGVDKFYSLESEICCNADCYKFTSIKGFAIALRHTRDMPFKDLVDLLDKKVEEKWNAVSLDIVKKELNSEHKIILNILKYLQ